MNSAWEDSLFELIRQTATDLPADVESSLRKAQSREKRGTHAWWVLSSILENVDLARRNDAPLCQDTGALNFYFQVPAGFDTNALLSATRSAVSRATRVGYLRQNTVDAVTGGQYETNIAHGSPVCHFEQGARKVVDVRLILKGGGSENVSAQYSLPDTTLNAGRDLQGVWRCVLDVVVRAQGGGCAPGVLGICIGGDRMTGFEHAKRQFLRKLDARSPVRTLAKLERRLLRDIRQLRIGPMGLGGETTLLGLGVDSLARLPACYFVTVSYMCWALRRRGVMLTQDGAIRRRLYR